MFLLFLASLLIDVVILVVSVNPFLNRLAILLKHIGVK